MQSNLDKYKKDLKKLTRKGTLLQVAMEYECYPEQVEELYGTSKDGIQAVY